VRTARPDAHLEAPVALLLEDRGDVRAAHRPDHVDQVLGLADAEPGVGQIRLQQIGPHQVGLGDLVEPAEGDAEQAQVRRPMILVEDLREVRVVERVLAQPGGDPEGLGRHGLVLEPSRVRDEPGVQTEGARVGELTTDPIDQARHDLARRGGIRIDESDRAHPVVRSMVVDPDQLGGRVRGRTEDAEPVEGRAIAGHHHRRCRRESVGRDQEIQAGQHLRPAREALGLVGVRAGDGGPSRHQVVRESEHGTEGVRVGVHVARDRDVVGFP
jgi:hypothetical protein